MQLFHYVFIDLGEGLLHRVPKNGVVLQEVLDNFQEVAVSCPQVKVVDLILRLTKRPQGYQLPELVSELVLESNDKEVDTLDLVMLNFVLDLSICATCSLLTRCRHSFSSTYIWAGLTRAARSASSSRTNAGLVCLNDTE